MMEKCAFAQLDCTPCVLCYGFFSFPAPVDPLLVCSFSLKQRITLGERQWPVGLALVFDR